MGFVAQGLEPTITVGGRILNNLKNLIILGANMTTSNDYYSLRVPNGTTAYQVPNGFQLRILAKKAVVNVASQTVALGLGYGDTASTGAVPTTPIYEFGIQQGQSASGVGTNVEASTDFVVPAGKYPFVFDANSAAGGQYQLFGYLEAV